MNQSLKNIIIDKIHNSPQQRITFAEYMDLVLYYPDYGYYSSDNLDIGSQGDFFTSSSLGADFGELLAIQFQQMWEIMDCPSPFILVEIGAGQGLLASDILYYLKLNHPDFLQAIQYMIIEKSASLIKKQQQKLQSYLDFGINLSWKSWQDLPDNFIIGCCFSNELVDAFPVHKVIFQEGKLQEVYVKYNHNFQEIIDNISTKKLEEYFKLIQINFTSNIYPDGYQTEVNLAASDWLTTVANKLKKGYLLTIDYGYPAKKYYHPQRFQGTLKCYYQHRHHDNPYINIGNQDITTHVDFTALEMQGQLSGLECLGLTQQAMFLMALGLGKRLKLLSNGSFNFQELLQRRDALHQLIDPTGLGGFGVLIQSKNLTEKEKLNPLKGLDTP